MNCRAQSHFQFAAVAVAAFAVFLSASPAWADAIQAQPQASSITPYCVPWPIPTLPHPSAAFNRRTTWRDNGAILQIDYWRQPCSADDGQLVLTFTPVQGAPVICGGAPGEIIQNGERTSSFRFVRAVDGSAGDVLCGPIVAPVSVLIHIDDPDFVLDDNQPLEIYDEWGPGPNPNWYITDLPAYTGGPHALPTLPLHGDFSGSYFDPSRPGEGVLLEVGQIGQRRVLQLSWYTYDEGRPLWIFGNVDFEAGAHSVTLQLSTYAGARFGIEFDPADVVATPWGEAVVSFRSCQHLDFDWVRADGMQGEYRYSRLVQRLLGDGCKFLTPEP